MYGILGFVLITFFTTFGDVVENTASVYLYNTRTKTYDTIYALDSKIGTLVSLPKLCTHLNISWNWDWHKEQFQCYTAHDTVYFFSNVPFYKINESSFQIPYPPRHNDGQLYLKAELIQNILSSIIEEDIVWNEKSRIFKVDKVLDDELVISHGKTAVTNKKNGTNAALGRVDISAKDMSTAIEIFNKNPEDAINVVVLDPGHGGKDPGAIGPGGTMEKDVVLAIGLKLRDELQKVGSLDIFMTRTRDVFIPLRDRTKFANDKNADLFISIHANSISGNKKRKNSVRGYKIYFLSHAKNEDDRLTAMLENSVTKLEEQNQTMNYLQNVISDMANTEYLVESQDISIFIAEAFTRSLNKIYKLHTGVGQANFWVLNGAYMPSVLIETCFISNPFEEKLLKNKNFQKKVACAISEAVIHFKKKYEAGL